MDLNNYLSMPVVVNNNANNDEKQNFQFVANFKT